MICSFTGILSNQVGNIQVLYFLTVHVAYTHPSGAKKMLVDVWVILTDPMLYFFYFMTEGFGLHVEMILYVNYLPSMWTESNHHQRTAILEKSPCGYIHLFSTLVKDCILACSHSMDKQLTVNH